jgi:hypothetical protein
MLSLSAICGGESKAAEKRVTAAATISAALAIDAHACAGCTRMLPTGAYSKTQLSKGASKRCKDCTAGGTSTAAPSKPPAPLHVAAPSRAAVPLPACSKCRYKGVGHSDASGKFCCEWCWAGLEKRRWPTLGGHSPQFKALTAGMRPSSFSEDDRENKVALVEVGMEADAECAELERTGALNGRIVLGFDTESKPCFKSGEHNPICLIQLSTRSRAVLFRVKPLVAPHAESKACVVGLRGPTGGLPAAGRSGARGSPGHAPALRGAFREPASRSLCPCCRHRCRCRRRCANSSRTRR